MPLLDPSLIHQATVFCRMPDIVFVLVKHIVVGGGFDQQIVRKTDFTKHPAIGFAVDVGPNMAACFAWIDSV